MMPKFCERLAKCETLVRGLWNGLSPHELLPTPRTPRSMVQRCSAICSAQLRCPAARAGRKNRCKADAASYRLAKAVCQIVTTFHGTERDTVSIGFHGARQHGRTQAD